MNVAKGCGDLKKTIKAYQKADLLILDEWLIRSLTAQESYDILEIAEASVLPNQLYSALNMNQKNGMGELLPAKTPAVRLPKQSWIELFIIHTM